MRITGIELLHADGGWRTISFVKLSTDSGITGWSEFCETVWNPGLSQVITALAEHAIGEDPRAWLRLSTRLQAATKLAAGGLAMQAAAAIDNAAIDVAAKAAGVPAYRLLGGPLRNRVPVYWSHAGVFRAVNPRVFDELVGTPPLRSVDGFKAVGEQARLDGFTAMKTNPVSFRPDGAVMLNPGFRPTPDLDFSGSGRGYPLGGLIEQLEALRDGAGPGMEIMLDLNFSLRGDGILRVAQELDRLGLAWMEIDTDMPAALADTRRKLKTPIASLEFAPWRRGISPLDRGTRGRRRADRPELERRRASTAHRRFRRCHGCLGRGAQLLRPSGRSHQRGVLRLRPQSAHHGNRVGRCALA